MAAADLVVGITGRHAMQLILMYPAYASRITALPRDIADPYGGDLPEYEDCLQQIGEALADMFAGADGEDVHE